MNDQQRKSLLTVLNILADAIKEAKDIPLGHLYAMLMGKIGLNTYQFMISVLKSQGLVSEQAHLLTWVGGDQKVKVLK